MIAGMSVGELAKEVLRQQKAKRDFVVGGTAIELDALPSGEGDRLGLRVNGQGRFPLTDLAHDQLAARLDIPGKYYDRMRREVPELVAQNVNVWLGREKEKRLVRLLDDKVRAILSSRYRPLDNADLAAVVLPELERVGCRVESAAVTEARLYIQAVCPKIAGEIRVGDVSHAGLLISNSEVGLGSLRVEPLVYTLRCKNGMVLPEAIRKHHVGRGLGGDQDGDNFAHLLTDETRAADERAFWMKVRDVVRGSLTEATFQGHIRRLQATVERDLTGHPAEVVEAVAQRHSLADSEAGAVLRFLASGGAMSQFGLVDAVTSTANIAENYDRAVELQRVGGLLAYMPAADWEVLNRN